MDHAPRSRLRRSRRRGAEEGGLDEGRTGGGMERGGWVPWVAGWVTALAWVGVLLGYGLAASPAFETMPLHFRATENIALLASGRNEPYALPLVVEHRGPGRYRHRIEWDLPRYDGPMGRLGEDRHVPRFDLPEDGLLQVGVYLDRVAGDHAPWLGEEPLGLVSGWLRLPGGRAFRLERPEQARRGHLLRFVAEVPGSDGTEPTDGESPTSVGMIIETRDGGPRYLRGWVRTLSGGSEEAGTPPLGRLVVRLGSMPGQAPGTTNLFYPEGIAATPLEEPVPSRVALLARVSGIGTATVLWIWGVAGAMAGLGMGCLAVLARGNGRWPGRWGLAGVTAGVLGFGLPAVHWVPPLHGADEARHAMSYARAIEDPALLDAVVAMTGKEWVGGLVAQPDAKLTTGSLREADGLYFNRGALEPGRMDAWIQDYRWRSPWVARLWGATAWMTEGRPAAERLLWVRAGQVGMGAVLLGIGAALAARAAPGGGGRLHVGWVLLWMPLAVVLGTVSNYAVLIGVAGLLGGAVTATWWRRDWDPWVAGTLGVALGLAFHTSLNAIPWVAAVALWLGHRPWRQGWQAREGVPRAGWGTRSMWVGWGWVAAGFAVCRGLTTEAFDAELFRRAGWGEGEMGNRPGWREPALLWGLFCGGMALLEAVAGRVGAGWRTEARERWRRAGCVGGWLVLVGGVAVALVSVVRTPPVLPDREGPWRHYPVVPSTGCPVRTVGEIQFPATEVDRGRQVREVLAVWAANLTPMPRDVILVRAFWTGLLMGEVRVAGWVVGMGMSLALAGVVRLGWGVVRGRDGAGGVWLVFAAAAVVVCLALLAAAYWPRNLHARYAMPLGMLTLAGASLGACPILDRLQRHHPAWAVGCLTVLALLVQGAWVAALSGRYF
ncbi:MAG: hypothetical protein KF833_04995 [Verrucomicrobiae bacterium]|nr:hypothetical protein [Verrucomicrobiae bacterium]